MLPPGGLGDCGQKNGASKVARTSVYSDTLQPMNYNMAQPTVCYALDYSHSCSEYVSRLEPSICQSSYLVGLAIPTLILYALARPNTFLSATSGRFLGRVDEKSEKQGLLHETFEAHQVAMSSYKTDVIPAIYHILTGKNQ